MIGCVIHWGERTESAFDQRWVELQWQYRERREQAGHNEFTSLNYDLILFRGLFFDKHLIKVKLNQIPVNFTTLDLGYLRRVRHNESLVNEQYLSLKEKYDADFHRIVYEESILMNSDDAQKELINKGESTVLLNCIDWCVSARANKHPIRIEYTGNMDYIKKADKLHIMHDFKVINSVFCFGSYGIYPGGSSSHGVSGSRFVFHQWTSGIPRSR